MDTNDDRYLGRAAYLGYLASSGGKSLVSGADLPSWDLLDPKIQKAWVAAAQAVQKDLAESATDDAAELKFVEE